MCGEECQDRRKLELLTHSIVMQVTVEIISVKQNANYETSMLNRLNADLRSRLAFIKNVAYGRMFIAYK
jgi:hypothetical protein